MRCANLPAESAVVVSKRIGDASLRVCEMTTSMALYVVRQKPSVIAWLTGVLFCRKKVTSNRKTGEFDVTENSQAAVDEPPPPGHLIDHPHDVARLFAADRYRTSAISKSSSKGTMSIHMPHAPRTLVQCSDAHQTLPKLKYFLVTRPTRISCSLIPLRTASLVQNIRRRSAYIDPLRCLLITLGTEVAWCSSLHGHI